MEEDKELLRLLGRHERVHATLCGGDRQRRRRVVGVSSQRMSAVSHEQSAPGSRFRPPGVNLLPHLIDRQLPHLRATSIQVEISAGEVDQRPFVFGSRPARDRRLRQTLLFQVATGVATDA